VCCFSQTSPSASTDAAKEGASDKVYKMGRGVSVPRAIYQPDPEYSKKARKKKLQGTCLLSIVVGADGKPHDIRVTRPLGPGLDEEAIKAVQQWKFEPARKDGQPVAVEVVVEVNFKLY
jgi:protein TonB